MIIIHSDYSDMENELSRLESMPTPRMTANLNTALDLSLKTTKGQVHVLTGRLKASGKSQSKKNKNDWVGTFSFGGTEVVHYAIYEKERDGTHNFFSQVHLLRTLFVSAIKQGLSRKGVK